MKIIKDIPFLFLVWILSAPVTAQIYRADYNASPKILPSVIQYNNPQYDSLGVKSVQLVSGTLPTVKDYKKKKRNENYYIPSLRVNAYTFNRNGWKIEWKITRNNHPYQIHKYRYIEEQNNLIIVITTSHYYMDSARLGQWNRDTERRVTYTNLSKTFSPPGRWNITCKYNLQGELIPNSCERTAHHNKYSGGSNTSYAEEYDSNGHLVKEVVKRYSYAGGSCTPDITEYPDNWIFYQYNDQGLVSRMKFTSAQSNWFSALFNSPNWILVEYEFHK